MKSTKDCSFVIKYRTVKVKMIVKEIISLKSQKNIYVVGDGFFLPQKHETTRYSFLHLDLSCESNLAKLASWLEFRCSLNVNISLHEPQKIFLVVIDTSDKRQGFHQMLSSLRLKLTRFRYNNSEYEIKLLSLSHIHSLKNVELF